MLLAGKFMALDIIPFPNEENGIVTKGQFAKYLARSIYLSLPVKYVYDMFLDFINRDTE